MLDLGEIFQVAVDIRDASGALVDPASAELTVTLPDGSTVSPAVPLPPAETGKVRVDYTTTVAGRHVYRLTTVGPVTAHADMFEVTGTDPGLIVSLADAKKHLNIPAATTVDDEELRGFIAAATGVIEDHAGAVVRREHVERFDGGRTSVMLSHAPVLAVESVTVDGEADTAGYWIDTPSGVLYRVSGGRRRSWPAGAGIVAVTYTAGRTAVPANISRAALVIIGHLWETQRNTSAGRPSLGDVETVPVGTGSGFAIPYRALELLGPPVPGVA